MLGTNGAMKLKALWLCRYDPITTALFGDSVTANNGVSDSVMVRVRDVGTARSGARGR